MPALSLSQSTPPCFVLLYKILGSFVILRKKDAMKRITLILVLLVSQAVWAQDWARAQLEKVSPGIGNGLR